MSADNRKLEKKQCNTSRNHDWDTAMEDLGYASFKVLHNSTVEAPFFFERDSESENCRNASNTATQGSQKLSFNSIQFQTLNKSNLSNSTLNSTLNATFWQESLSFPSTSCAQPEGSTDEDEQMCKSPLLQPNHLQCLAKRRKSHYPSVAFHSSPKKSKKILFPQPAQAPICRTRYYDGYEHLDIVGMLINTLPALECILANVSSHTLDTMTKVSERWAQAVHKSQRATERLQNHRFKMNLTKENKYLVKHTHVLSKSMNYNLVPLQPSNAIQQTNKNIIYSNSPKDDNCQLVEEKQRIKCPRCGKSSKVFSSQTTEHMPHTNRISSRTALSQTLPNTNPFSQPRAVIPRFHSQDQIISPSDENASDATVSYPIGQCTSVLCKFRFCVHCCSTPHPGVKCLVTELGTPSKIMMPSERLTPPKRHQNFDSKRSRKNSLKRLNF